tara:strand:- start:90974 stop:91834 length:861 start_codon:yes stop_codon:yes gene_type:complete
MKQLSIGFSKEEELENNLYGLFDEIGSFKKSNEYLRYLNYISRFKKYSIFNTTLVFAQKPTVGFFATKKHWKKEFNRTIKEDSRPLIMLRPRGPIMFAYDIDDTEGETNISDFLKRPIQSTGDVTDVMMSTLKISVAKCRIQLISVSNRQTLGGTISRTGTIASPFSLDLKIELNKAHDLVTNYTTLIHELAHLFLGHLGSSPSSLWPSRLGLSKDQKEFEAESVAYVIAKRMGLNSQSDKYLAGYVDRDVNIPRIDVRAIGKAIDWIEEMIKGRTPKIFSPDPKA